MDWGLMAAALSSAIGGTAIGATRYLVGSLSPVAIGLCRFGIGCLLLLPLCLWRGARWPRQRDAVGAMGLGMLLFTVFPLLREFARRTTPADRHARFPFGGLIQSAFNVGYAVSLVATAAHSFETGPSPQGRGGTNIFQLFVMRIS